MRKITNILAIAAVLMGTWFCLPASMQTTIANNAADMSGKIVMVADSSTGRTVTNLFTFNRGAAVPFAVGASSLKVTNLDADKLDGVDGIRYNTVTVTTTSTGTQNNFDPSSTIALGYQITLIRCNNATDLTITGLPAGVFDGQIVMFYSIGAGNVLFQDASLGSGSTVELQNFATSINTPISVKGSAVYAYDSTSTTWRMQSHDQGAIITYTPVWGNLGTANTTTGSSVSGRYQVIGRTVFYKISFAFGVGTVGGNAAYTWTIPLAASGASFHSGSAYISDAGTGVYGAIMTLQTTTTLVAYSTDVINTGVSNTVPMVWSAANGDSIQISGFYDIP